jgi:hypothetical protein
MRISGDGDIKEKLRETSPKTFEQDEPGRLTLKLDLEPGEKSAICLASSSNTPRTWFSEACDHPLSPAVAIPPFIPCWTSMSRMAEGMAAKTAAAMSSGHCEVY